MTSVELREKRAGLIKQARDLWTTAQARENGPTAEDKQEFDRVMSAANDLKSDYERAERLESEERDLDRAEPRAGSPITGQEPRGNGNGRHGQGQIRTAAEYRASAEYRAVFSDWLMTGHVRFDKVPAEYRDTIIGTDSKGGYLSTPTQLANEIVKQCDDFVFVRALATKVQCTEAKAVGVPQLATRMADASWTTEVLAVTEDTTQAFARRDLTPTLLSKLAKVSIRTLSGAANAESLIVSELGYKNAITEEKGYMTGTGSSQPLGIFVASANGIASGRDVSTGNTSTAIGAANLYEMKYSLKAPYRNDPTCRWLWSRTAVNAIMQLKDSQNRYLWEPSLQAGQPDRLLNVQVAESEYVPSTFTTGLYVGAIGALRYYWIAEVAEMQIQRLIERYADTNEVGFISRRYVDGSPVLSEAFARSKLA
jgi:HK97 family phage major capsid protein